MLDQAPRVLNALLDMAVEEGHLDVVLALTVLSKMIIQVKSLVIFLFLCHFLYLSLLSALYVLSCPFMPLKRIESLIWIRFNMAFYL